MKIIPAETVRDYLADRLNFWPYFSDANYAVPTKAWLLEKALPAFHLLLDQLSVLGYSKECWDCDDYAMAFVFFCRMLHARTVAQAKLPPCGITVSHAWLTMADGGKHALCAALVDGCEVIIVEPQPSANPLPTLTPEEEQSCEFCQF